MIICCPVGSYYKEGLNPVKIYVESEYVRAVKGGTGFIKSGGNYAASLKGQEKAEKLNYSDKAVSKWERGEAVPDLVVLKQIADYYEITIDTLLLEPEKSAPKPINNYKSKL